MNASKILKPLLIAGALLLGGTGMANSQTLRVDGHPNAQHIAYHRDGYRHGWDRRYHRDWRYERRGYRWRTGYVGPRYYHRGCGWVRGHWGRFGWVPGHRVCY